MRGYPRSLARGSLRPPLHPPKAGILSQPLHPRAAGESGPRQRRLCLCDTTRPFRLDLTRGFRAPWNHDQEYPSWTWTSRLAGPTTGPCRPWNRAGHRGARQLKGNVMTGTIDKWTARTRVMKYEFSDEELEMLEGRAAALGLTLEEYLRVAMGMAP
jgi:hypothetical protein